MYPNHTLKFVNFPTIAANPERLAQCVETIEAEKERPNWRLLHTPDLRYFVTASSRPDDAIEHFVKETVGNPTAAFGECFGINTRDRIVSENIHAVARHAAELIPVWSEDADILVMLGTIQGPRTNFVQTTPKSATTERLVSCNEIGRQVQCGAVKLNPAGPNTFLKTDIRQLHFASPDGGRLAKNPNLVQVVNRRQRSTEFNKRYKHMEAWITPADPAHSVDRELLKACKVPALANHQGPKMTGLSVAFLAIAKIRHSRSYVVDAVAYEMLPATGLVGYLNCTRMDIADFYLDPKGGEDLNHKGARLFLDLTTRDSVSDSEEN